MKKWWIAGVIVVVVLVMAVVLLGNGGNPSQSDCLNSTIDWEAARALDVAVMADGWGTPEPLAINTPCMEDSAFIALDGNTVYYMAYPHYIGEKIPDVSAVGSYQSDSPFMTSTQIASGINTRVGVQITQSGDWFYSNPSDSVQHGKGDDDIFRNDEVLPFNTNADWTNPHYCEARDELWFDCIRDQQICILTDAAANGFSGTPEAAPYPINDDDYNAQAHLTPDCNTLYFISTRSHTHIEIFTSDRQVDDSWSEPELVVHSNIGVGEPTLTADGNDLYFVQIVGAPDLSVGQIDIFHSQRL